MTNLTNFNNEAPKAVSEGSREYPHKLSRKKTALFDIKYTTRKPIL